MNLIESDFNSSCMQCQSIFSFECNFFFFLIFFSSIHSSSLVVCNNTEPNWINMYPKIVFVWPFFLLLLIWNAQVCNDCCTNFFFHHLLIGCTFMFITLTICPQFLHYLYPLISLRQVVKPYIMNKINVHNLPLLWSIYLQSHCMLI
jgi:hypothetical protein